jgi:hypothetical protein
MLAKTQKSAAPLDLDAVEHDLVEAQAKLSTIDAGEPAALSSASAYDEYRAKRDAAVTEIDRLTRLRNRTVADAAEMEQQEQLAALQKKIDAQRLANEKLAARIRTEGGAAVATLLKLARDIAEAEVIDEELTAALPRDAEPIVGADRLCREALLGAPAQLSLARSLSMIALRSRA